MKPDTRFAMDSLVAWFEDRFLPLGEVSIPCWDYGFTMGVAITEQLRTYGGRLPLLDRHLNRFSQGTAAINIHFDFDRNRLRDLISETVSRNLKWLPAGTELSVGVVATAGDHIARLPDPVGENFDESERILIDHRLLITAIPLQTVWREVAKAGVKLVTIDQPEIPSICLPKHIKCRSRMHYYLAEREASRKRKGSYALLRDIQGCYLEGTTASLVISIEGELVAPPVASVLPSVSVETLEEVVCPNLGLSFRRQAIDHATLMAADAWYWLSTPFAILPVTEIACFDPAGQDSLIQRGSGKQYQALLAVWRDQIGRP